MPSACAKVVQTGKSGRDLCKICARDFGWPGGGDGWKISKESF
jgi:hypothetical protein